MTVVRLSKIGAIAVAFWLSATALQAHESDAAFGEQVRAYLLSNPDVLLEVMDILAADQESRATRELLEPHLPVIFGMDMDLRMGSGNASRVLVEFFDYNCAVCKENIPAMKAFVLANPDVAIVKKHLPILTPGSERAVRFVLAARKAFGTEAYNTLHNTIYAQMGPLHLAGLEDAARKLNLDPKAITSLMQDNDITDLIDQNRNIAIALNVIGTPTFVTTEGLHVGAVTEEILAGLLGGET